MHGVDPNIGGGGISGVVSCFQWKQEERQRGYAAEMRLTDVFTTLRSGVVQKSGGYLRGARMVSICLGKWAESLNERERKREREREWE